MHLLAISGSLRPESYNTALLRNAPDLLPEGTTFELLDWREVPIWDGSPRTSATEAVMARIASADALLISTPEFNHSVPGGLKNLLDWASRPPDAAPLHGKPVGIWSSSPGAIGGARAQVHLKTILLANGCPVFPGREVNVSAVAGKLDRDGVLTDEPTRTFLAAWLREFVPWAAAQARITIG